ncbi:MAG TPA: hypothetical protein DEQ80_04165 [Anaerolinea thermolimosa]|uniref:Uncharacterized protein n=1 Tax=Anaerolinea thermolimosa TaxID=229919 RepID=A0A3D1JF15_9CHLR|nr:hypothetical protein [Anaerolinea thermolimosa]
MNDQASGAPAPNAGAPRVSPAKAASLPPEPPKPKKPSLWARLLDKETRRGRFMRALIRTLGTIVGLYALGFFTAYTLLYQPLQRQNRVAEAEVTRLRASLEEKQAELDKAALTFLGVEKLNEQLSGDLERAQAQVVVLQALVQVGEARLKLAGNDTSAARLALNQAEQTLQGSMAQLEKLGAAKKETFQQLFELVRDDLGRSSRLAEQDLERLTSELQLLRESLAK